MNTLIIIITKISIPSFDNTFCSLRFCYCSILIFIQSFVLFIMICTVISFIKFFRLYSVESSQISASSSTLSGLIILRQFSPFAFCRSSTIWIVPRNFMQSHLASQYLIQSTSLRIHSCSSSFM